ncbi:MAG: hypothetical protein ABSC13_04820 [Dehalococcoidia bacterium]
MPAWFQSILLASLAAIVFAIILPAFKGFAGAGAFAVYCLAMTVALGLMVFAIITFRYLKIVVGDGQVRFGFGLLRKSIPLEWIKSYEAKRYNWLIYGGWGIRFSLGGRRAWSVRVFRRAWSLPLRKADGCDATLSLPVTPSVLSKP